MRIFFILTFVISLFGNLVDNTVHAVVKDNTSFESLKELHDHKGHEHHQTSEHVHNCENGQCSHLSQLFFSHSQIELYFASIQHTFEESIERLFSLSSSGIDHPPRF